MHDSFVTSPDYKCSQVLASVKQDWIIRRICKLAVPKSTLTSNNSFIILKQPQLVRPHLKLLLALHLSLYFLDP